MQHWFLNVHTLIDSSRADSVWWLSMGCPADWIISTTSLASIVSWRQCTVRSAFAQMAQAKGMPGPGRGDSTKFKVSLRELSPAYRTQGRRSPQNWGVVLTFVKTLCECRLEHTVVQFRQWLRCLSRPCWSWKSYNNPCRCTKKSSPPPQYIIHPWVVWFRVPSLIPHLKTASEANAQLGWFLKAIWGVCCLNHRTSAGSRQHTG